MASESVAGSPTVAPAGTSMLTGTMPWGMISVQSTVIEVGEDAVELMIAHWRFPGGVSHESIVEHKRPGSLFVVADLVTASAPISGESINATCKSAVLSVALKLRSQPVAIKVASDCAHAAMYFHVAFHVVLVRALIQ